MPKDKTVTISVPGTDNETRTYNVSNDIKTISDWSETENDESKKYLYIINKSPVTLPDIFIKLDECNAPVSTGLTIEDLN